MYSVSFERFQALDQALVPMLLKALLLVGVQWSGLKTILNIEDHLPILELSSIHTRSLACCDWVKVQCGRGRIERFQTRNCCVPNT